MSKLLDILCGEFEAIDDAQKHCVSWLVREEIRLVEVIRERFNGLKVLYYVLSDTPRSIQYVKALIKNEIKLGAVLIYGVAHEGECRHKETHVIHEAN